MGSDSVCNATQVGKDRVTRPLKVYSLEYASGCPPASPRMMP